jgi:hypothetical protein
MKQPFNSIVDVLPKAFPIPVSLTTACDDETNPLVQDGKYTFNTSTFQNTILNTNRNDDKLF